MGMFRYAARSKTGSCNLRTRSRCGWHEPECLPSQSPCGKSYRPRPRIPLDCSRRAPQAL